METTKPRSRGYGPLGREGDGPAERSKGGSIARVPDPQHRHKGNTSAPPPPVPAAVEAVPASVEVALGQLRPARDPEDAARIQRHVRAVEQLEEARLTHLAVSVLLRQQRPAVEQAVRSAAREVFSSADPDRLPLALEKLGHALRAKSALEAAEVMAAAISAEHDETRRRLAVEAVELQPRLADVDAAARRVEAAIGSARRQINYHRGGSGHPLGGLERAEIPKLESALEDLEAERAALIALLRPVEVARKQAAVSVAQSALAAAEA